MATIRAYTDPSQSKTLSKILPLESADMCYIKHSSSNNQNWEFNDDFPPMVLGNVSINEMTTETLPCWSLAALLDILDFPSLTQNKEDEWEICVPNCESDEYIEVSAVNPIDACVEMIEKLHEQKL